VPESAKAAEGLLDRTPQGEPLTSSRDAILQLGRDVADRRRKRMTLPSTPSAIARVTGDPAPPRAQ
jgi:hypothetical protein